jgi:hypothetical protein
MFHLSSSSTWHVSFIIIINMACFIYHHHQHGMFHLSSSSTWHVSFIIIIITHHHHQHGMFLVSSSSSLIVIMACFFHHAAPLIKMQTMVAITTLTLLSHKCTLMLSQARGFCFKHGAHGACRVAGCYANATDITTKLCFKHGGKGNGELTNINANSAEYTSKEELLSTSSAPSISSTLTTCPVDGSVAASTTVAVAIAAGAAGAAGVGGVGGVGADDVAPGAAADVVATPVKTAAACSLDSVAAPDEMRPAMAAEVTVAVASAL